MNITPLEFRVIQTLVRELCGLALSDEKLYLVKTRLEPVVQSHGFACFADYLAAVQRLEGTRLREELVESLTTGETSFNRDVHLYNALRQQIVPEIARRLKQRQETGLRSQIARIWSAGCSTGQEPYSIALAIMDGSSEPAALGISPEQFQIVATDVSERVLQIARQGRYPRRDIERGLSIVQRQSHFLQEGEHWVASALLKKRIEFRQLNLIHPLPALGQFDVIFCRNVLIYFELATRKRLCEKFFELLVPDGLLILGSTESLYGLSESFVTEHISGTTVFRKRLS